MDCRRGRGKFTDEISRPEGGSGEVVGANAEAIRSGTLGELACAGAGTAVDDDADAAATTWRATGDNVRLLVADELVAAERPPSVVNGRAAGLEVSGRRPPCNARGLPHCLGCTPSGPAPPPGHQGCTPSARADSVCCSATGACGPVTPMASLPRRSGDPRRRMGGDCRDEAPGLGTTGLRAPAVVVGIFATTRPCCAHFLSTGAVDTPSGTARLELLELLNVSTGLGLGLGLVSGDVRGLALSGAAACFATAARPRCSLPPLTGKVARCRS